MRRNRASTTSSGLGDGRAKTIAGGARRPEPTGVSSGADESPAHHCRRMRNITVAEEVRDGADDDGSWLSDDIPHRPHPFQGEVTHAALEECTPPSTSMPSRHSRNHTLRAS